MLLYATMLEVFSFFWSVRLCTITLTQIVPAGTKTGIEAVYTFYGKRRILSPMSLSQKRSLPSGT